jgi:hypothetical protein
MSVEEKDFAAISREIMNKYHEEMHKYLNSKAAGKLTDADVVIMIMNLTIGIGTNIYYSLKQILPTTVMDFDFMRAKMVNEFSDTFEKIKDYNPKENMMPLTVEQVKEIQEKGSTTITFPDGRQRVVTEEELLVKKYDAERMADHVKKEVKDAANTPKIISASGQPLR